MRICLLEPYTAGSHATWARDLMRFSGHRFDLLDLPGRHWKWRMHGGALTLARQYLAGGLQPDLLLATDMLDFSTFLAMTRQQTGHLPTAIYFHENQFEYPWSPRDKDRESGRDLHYAFINLSSALAADRVLFNSHFHRQSFLHALPGMLKGFPDFRELESCKKIADKSAVLPLGLDLRALDTYRPTSVNSAEPPLLIWNHRWEHDKNPGDFFAILNQLQTEGLSFRVALLGESFGEQSEVFQQARAALGHRVVHYGYVKNFADYARWLWRADILPVTSRHDFFGASVVQAIYCGCLPLLPERLAYPEHLPVQDHGTFLYRNLRELLERLRQLLRDGATQAPERLAQHVARYDWSRLITTYDSALSQLASPKKPDM